MDGKHPSLKAWKHKFDNPFRNQLANNGGEPQSWYVIYFALQTQNPRRGYLIRSVATALQDPMKSPELTIEYIARQIGYVYLHRPLLYGGNGAGVEIYLHDHHEIWAFIVDRRDDLLNARSYQLSVEGCGANNFSSFYAATHRNATEDEIAAYVVKQWRAISEQMGVPVPYDEITNEFVADGLD